MKLHPRSLAPLPLALAALLAFSTGDLHVAEAQGTPSLTVDVGTEGNGPLEVGDTEDCVSVEVGDRFEVDIVIEDVRDLLAWEAPFEFDPAVVIVIDHDVKLFQEANPGSSVIDVSASLPDDSGFHALSALDSSDPPAVDSGSGTLARLTLEAIAEGESPLRLGERDIDGDGDLDRATLLKDVDAAVIGDEDGDDFFDGEQAEALVVVGDDCPPGTTVAEAGGSDSGSSNTWLYVVAGIVAALAVLGGAGGFVLFSRLNRSRPGAGTEA